MKILKCPSCGAHLKNTNGVCEYCGNVYVEEDKKENKNIMPNSNVEIIEPDRVEENKVLSNYDLTKFDEVVKNNIGLFILAVIMITFCFPVGVIIFISLIEKTKKKN